MDPSRAVAPFAGRTEFTHPTPSDGYAASTLFGMATIRDLAAELKVPMGDVVKALMNIGVMRPVNQELPAEDAAFVKKLLQTPPPQKRDDGGAFGEGVREPRRPHPPTPSGEATGAEEV
jgi:Translation initiation factor IF-2, N-terminal region